MKERLPRFASSDEFLGAEPRTGSQRRSSAETSGSRSAPRTVDEFGIQATLYAAPPADVVPDESDLDISLCEYLTDLGCELDAFDAAMSRDGFRREDLRSATIWSDDRFFVSLLRALAAASQSYLFDAKRRPGGFRASLRYLARREARQHAGRAMGRLALDFDPVLWSRVDGPALSHDELSRGSAHWEAFVRRTAEVAEQRRATTVGRGIPWSVELTLELSIHEFRRLVGEHDTGCSIVRRDVLRSALSEPEPAFAIHALTVFLGANSDEFARALDPYDEPAADR